MNNFGSLKRAKKNLRFEGTLNNDSVLKSLRNKLGLSVKRLDVLAVSEGSNKGNLEKHCYGENISTTKEASIT